MNIVIYLSVLVFTFHEIYNQRQIIQFIFEKFSFFEKKKCNFNTKVSLLSKQCFCGPVWAFCGLAPKFEKLLDQRGAIMCQPAVNNFGGPSWGLYGQAHKIYQRINFVGLPTKAPKMTHLHLLTTGYPEMAPEQTIQKTSFGYLD